MKKLIITLFLLSTLSINSSDFLFKKINASQGLTNDSVSSIVQDEKGFLWFGTQHGLNRYDGYNFTKYTKEPFETNTLSHDLIQTLYMENGNKLWIGTYHGLNMLDIKTGVFTNYEFEKDNPNSLSDNVVVSITKGNDNNIWIGTLDGLNKFNKEKQEFTRYKYDENNEKTISNNTIRSLFSDKDGNLWIGTYKGLNKYNPETNDFTRYEMGKDYESDYIMDITQVEDNKILIGTWDGAGLVEFNTKTKEFTPYNLPVKEVYQILAYNKDIIYIATWGNGLLYFNKSEESYEIYKKNENKYSISHNIVYSLFKDKSGIVWAGTNGSGINKLVQIDNLIKRISHNPDDETTIDHGKINAIYQDKYDNLWIGIYGSGLNYYNRKTGKIKKYSHDKNNPKSLSNNIVNTINEDTNQNLWIATNDGLNKYNYKTDDFDRIYKDEDSNYAPMDNIVYCTMEDSKKRFWIGGYNSGISVYNTKTGKTNQYYYEKDDKTSLSNNLIYQIFEDSQGEIWICTNDGLNKYNEKTNNFTRYINNPNDNTTLSSNTTRVIYEDSKNRLWIGTISGGLNLFNRETETFEYFAQNEGFPVNSIVGILEDSNGNLWLSTTKGLVVFNYETKFLRILSEEDGILGTQFYNGHLKNNKGEMFFGSDEGLMIINTIDFKRNTYIPPVYLTSIKLFDKEIKNQYNSSYIEEIELKYNDNFISFEFAALDYTSPLKNSYAYKMEGFDKSWIYSGNRRYASYTNLKPGEYSFKVKASNNDGLWNEQGTSISIKINPPYWNTRTAYFIYSLFIFLFIYMIFNIFKYIEKRKFELREQEFERKKLVDLENEIDKRKIIQTELEKSKAAAEEANMAKGRFLANISHELKTPLNAILGFSNSIIKISNDINNNKIKEHANIIKKSGSQLLSLINDILDLSSLEFDKIQIHNTTMEIKSLLNEIVDIFSLSSMEKGVNLTYKINPDVPEKIFCDEIRLRQILFNVVGNAVKFTSEGSITISIEAFFLNNERSEFDLMIIVKDSGIGISKDDQNEVFKPFIQQKNQNAKYGGTGLGLAITKRLIEKMNGTITLESKLNKGSTFSIILKNIKTTNVNKINKNEIKNSNEDYSKFNYNLLNANDKLIFDKIYNTQIFPLWMKINEQLIPDEWEKFDNILVELNKELSNDKISSIEKTLRQSLDPLSIAKLKKAIEIIKTYIIK